MHARHGSVIALLMVLAAGARAQSASAPTAAPSKYKPCSLVTKSQAEALTGQKVTTTTDRDIPYKKDAKNDHDGVISTCGYMYAPGKGLSLVVSSSPVTPEGRAKGEAKAKAAVEKVKTMGAKIEEKKYGAITCSTVQLTGDMAMFSSTSCGAEKGPLFFAMTVSKGPNGFVAMDQVHALVVQVLAGLP